VLDSDDPLFALFLFSPVVLRSGEERAVARERDAKQQQVEFQQQKNSYSSLLRTLSNGTAAAKAKTANGAGAAAASTHAAQPNVSLLISSPTPSPSLQPLSSLVVPSPAASAAAGHVGSRAASAATVLDEMKQHPSSSAEPVVGVLTPPPASPQPQPTPQPLPLQIMRPPPSFEPDSPVFSAAPVPAAAAGAAMDISEPDILFFSPPH